MKRWLILDSYYIARRAYYTTGALSFNDIKTGVVFGFFKEVVSLMDQFNGGPIVFCFDAKGSKRKELFPDYKKKRHTKELDEVERLALFEMKRQVEKLRTSYLKTVGYANIFWEDGFEADDIIATTVAQVPEEDEVIIVSADKDFYQLISPRVRCYNPDKGVMMSLQKFVQTYGIQPRRWAQKLALAGCKTDEVPGIPGVGEKTAIKYIRGELKPTSRAFRRIESEKGAERIARNKRLVKLPFAGTPTFTIAPDNVTAEGWERVCDKLGMNSLKGQAPLMGREFRRKRSTRETFGL